MIQRHVSSTWAEEAAEALLARLRQRPALRMCLATGSTPLPLYGRLVQTPEAFDAASVLLLDEFGGLPPDEPGRCDAVLRRGLVDHVPLADYRPVDVDASDLAAECAAIDSWIDHGGLDLAVLGLGMNGHLGMNEPGAPPAGRTARVDLDPSTIERAGRYFEGRAHPTWGVTIGLGDLLATREVWVVAGGDEKAAIVRRSLEGPPDPNVPASLLLGHANCTWWLDPAAGGL